jgi:hypothetical protein
MSLYLGNVSVFRARHGHMDRGSRMVTEYSAALYTILQEGQSRCWEIVSVRVQVISDEKQLPLTSPDASLHRGHNTQEPGPIPYLQSLYQPICKK